MQIKRFSTLRESNNATGLAIVIDVLRAFSTLCVVWDKNPKQVYAFTSVESTLKYKDQVENPILIGERDGKKIAGFDFGNSPTALKSSDLQDKTVLFTTSAGTQGLLAVPYADTILTGSLVNANAIVNEVLHRKPQTVSIVAMGLAGREKTEEDEQCADYIENRLRGHQTLSQIEIRNIVRANPCADRFFAEENQSFSPTSDFEFCLQLNQYPFAVEAKRISGTIVELLRLP